MRKVKLSNFTVQQRKLLAYIGSLEISDLRTGVNSYITSQQPLNISWSSASHTIIFTVINVHINVHINLICTLAASESESNTVLNNDRSRILEEITVSV